MTMTDLTLRVIAEKLDRLTADVTADLGPAAPQVTLTARTGHGFLTMLTRDADLPHRDQDIVVGSAGALLKVLGYDASPAVVDGRPAYTVNRPPRPPALPARPAWNPPPGLPF